MTPGRSARVSREPFDALGHATRRAIVEQLRDGPRSVAEITASTSISQPSVSRHLRQLAFAANTLTVVAAQLLILRRLAGHQRTTAVALAAAWAASWAMMTAAGHLGGGAAAVTAFAAAMVIFALGECLLSPTLPAIINDLAPPGAAGRYNGPGALAFTTGFLAGPAGGAALGAGFGTALFATLAAACAAAAAAAPRLRRHLPAAANHSPPPPTGRPLPPPADGHQPHTPQEPHRSHHAAAAWPGRPPPIQPAGNQLTAQQAHTPRTARSAYRSHSGFASSTLRVCGRADMSGCRSPSADFP